MTLPTIDQAITMGSEAFASGAVRLCPIAPPADNAVGDGWSGIARAWYKGWDAANLADDAAPLPDEAAVAPSCAYCHRAVTAGSMIDAKWVCRDCWYDGAVLAEHMAPFIAVLNHVTGQAWEPVHTGGGCFAIATATTVEWARPPVQRQLMVSFDHGPFAGDSALSEIAGGLMLGVYDLGSGDEILTRTALPADGIPSIQIVLYANDYISERTS